MAPDDAQPPYITYDLTAIPDDGESLQIANIDIDGWDIVHDNDTAELENLMYNINIQTNKKTLRAEGMAMTLYLDENTLIDRIKDSEKKYFYQNKENRKELKQV